VFINKTTTGANNLIGEKLSEKRKAIALSQKKFADRLQLLGLDVDKNAIQRIECGKRFVTDIELTFICKALDVSPNDLLEWE
jgi:transcriptional regulator with XRE-family HTH domain